MAKEKFDRSKPHVNVGRSGISTTEDDIDGGDHEVLSKHNPKNKYRSFDSIDQRAGREGERNHDRDRARGIRDFEAALCACDCPGHADYIKNMITERRRWTGDPGVAATDGPMPQTRNTSGWRARWECLHVVFLKQVRRG